MFSTSCKNPDFVAINAQFVKSPLITAAVPSAGRICCSSFSITVWFTDTGRKKMSGNGGWKFVSLFFSDRRVIGIGVGGDGGWCDAISCSPIVTHLPQRSTRGSCVRARVTRVERTVVVCSGVVDNYTPSAPINLAPRAHTPQRTHALNVRGCGVQSARARVCGLNFCQALSFFRLPPGRDIENR